MSNSALVRIEFDCRPGAIAQSLALREPKYQETAAYCHFGREAVTKNLVCQCKFCYVPLSCIDPFHAVEVKYVI